MADDEKGEEKPTPAKADDKPPDMTREDMAETVKALLAKHGSPDSALRILLSEHGTLRDKLKEARDRIPAAGSVVLKPDEAKVFDRYRGLGDPKSLEDALAERDHYREKAEGYERDRHHAEVAAAAGFKPSVFTRLATTEDLELVVKEEKAKDGKPAKVAYVRSKDENDKDVDTPLAEYAEAHWADFLPALKGDAAPRPTTPPGSPSRSHTTPPRPAIRPDQPRRSLVR